MNLCSVSQFCWYIDAIIVHVIKSNFVGTSRHASANPNKLPSTALAVQCGLRNSGSYEKGGEGLGGVAWRVSEPGLCFLNLTARCCVASQLGRGRNPQPGGPLDHLPNCPLFPGRLGFGAHRSPRHPDGGE